MLQLEAFSVSDQPVEKFKLILNLVLIIFEKASIKYRKHAYIV